MNASKGAAALPASNSAVPGVSKPQSKPPVNDLDDLDDMLQDFEGGDDDDLDDLLDELDMGGMTKPQPKNLDSKTIFNT